MGEKKILHVIVPFSKKGIELVKETDIVFRDSKRIVYQKNPWYIDESSEIESIKNIPFLSLDASYGLVYYLNKRGVSVTFNSSHIVLEYFVEVEGGVFIDDYFIIGKWLNSSEMAMAGFETEISISDPYKSLKMIVSDEGLYPIIIFDKKEYKEYTFGGEWSEKRIEILRIFIEPVLRGTRKER